jgi:hypothetical protein
MKTDNGESVCIAPGSDDRKALLLNQLDEQLTQSPDWTDVIEKVGRNVVLNILTGLHRQLDQCGTVAIEPGQAEDTKPTLQ